MAADTVTYGRQDEGMSGWAIAEGVLLVILGLFAVFSPYVTAAAAAVVFPVFLFVKGIVELVVAFRSRGSKAFWHAAFGAVSIIAGIALFARPAISGLTLVIVLIAYFFVDGIARVIVSLASRSHGWGWVLASGIIDIGLGVYLLMQPISVSVFVLGLLIGIDILAAGVVMLAVGAQERTHGAPTGVSPA